jgi:hypothetical protein
MGRWADNWFECGLCLVILVITGAQIYRFDRPPCETSPITGHCGCDAKSCDMPCMGCCPGGCKYTPDPSGCPHE